MTSVDDENGQIEALLLGALAAITLICSMLLGAILWT